MDGARSVRWGSLARMGLWEAVRDGPKTQALDAGARPSNPRLSSNPGSSGSHAEAWARRDTVLKDSDGAERRGAACCDPTSRSARHSPRGTIVGAVSGYVGASWAARSGPSCAATSPSSSSSPVVRSEEHTSELQSHSDLVCRLLLEKKKEYEADKRKRLGEEGANQHRMLVKALK